MKLIRNLVITKIDDNKYLMINTINGLMDMVNQNIIEVLKKWSFIETINVQSEMEMKLYNQLQIRGYLCCNDEEEEKLKDNIIQSLRKKQKENQLKIRGLTFVMTYDCNFKCPYCFESNDKRLSGHYITKEHIDAALNFAGKDLDHIGLFGGEPLLPQNRKAIEYLIERAPDKSYDIISNGYCLDFYIDLFSQVNIHYVMVTLDGNKSTHDKRRFLANGQPTYDKIFKNIRQCLQHHIPIRIRMNIDQDTIEESDQLRDFLLKEFHEYYDLLSFEISPMMEINKFERNELFRTLIKKDDKREEHNSKNLALTGFSPIVNSLLHKKKLYPTYSYCFDHQNNYIVDPFGFIYPCLAAVGRSEFAVGMFYPHVNFFEKSVRNRNIETISKCRDCEYSLLCGGGCPLKLRNSKDLYQPECGSILNDIHCLIPLFLSTRCQ